MWTVPELQRYPWKLYLNKSVEDIVIAPDLKVFISDNSNMCSCSRNAQISFVENP